jgi:hypothetical protein
LLILLAFAFIAARAAFAISLIELTPRKVESGVPLLPWDFHTAEQHPPKSEVRECDRYMRGHSGASAGFDRRALRWLRLYLTYRC